jgi:O-antigen ligase
LRIADCAIGNYGSPTKSAAFLKSEIRNSLNTSTFGSRIANYGSQIEARRIANVLNSKFEIRNSKFPIRNSKFPMTALLDKAIAAGLMLAIAFTTLALGTVEAWSIALFELIVIFLLLLWAAKAILEKHLAINAPAAALPLGAFVLLGLTQSIAIPGSDGRISSLSMDVEATRGAVPVIFFLFVCFLITANFFTSSERLRTLANFLIIFGLVLAVFALVQHFTWEGQLFWFRPAPTAGAGTGGPFVNRNHFAGYMEMLIPTPIALALSRAVRGEARLFYGFAAAIMGIAEAASLSRGGMVSLTAALLFIAAVSTLRREVRGARSEVGGGRLEVRGGARSEVGGARIEDRLEPGTSDLAPRTSDIAPRTSHLAPRTSRFNLRSSIFVLLIAAAIVAGIFWVGADSGLAERLAGSQFDASPYSRAGMRADTLRMFSAHPILGVGLGAFQTVYPIYDHGNGSTLIEFAHNDYVQTLADGGIVAGALAIWFIIVTFRAFVRGIRLRDPLRRGLALGAGAGIFAILVHSLFDFNLQLPSNALLFLALSAIVASVAGGQKAESGRQR